MILKFGLLLAACLSVFFGFSQSSFLMHDQFEIMQLTHDNCGHTIHNTQCFSQDDEWIVRRAVAPVDLVGIVKWAAHWSDVQAISLLRTHAPRFVVAPHALAVRVARVAEADLGIADADADGCWMNSPGTRWVKPSWQRWLLAELVFAAGRELLS